MLQGKYIKYTPKITFEIFEKYVLKEFINKPDIYKGVLKSDGSNKLGKEIMNYLESKGGKNLEGYFGNSEFNPYYFINSNGNIDHKNTIPEGYVLIELKSSTTITQINKEPIMEKKPLNKLPAYWYVVVTKDNLEVLSQWRFRSSSPILKLSVGQITGKIGGQSREHNPINRTEPFKEEISFEDFKRLELGEIGLSKGQEVKIVCSPIPRQTLYKPNTENYFPKVIEIK